MRDKFITAYILLGVATGFLVSPFVYSLGSGPQKVQDTLSVHEAPLTPITNKSKSEEVYNHFAEGKGLEPFDATNVGFREGTCWPYSDEESWMAMVCIGWIPPYPNPTP